MDYPDRRPMIVFPLHDQQGGMLAHLCRIIPDLKMLFQRAVVSVTPPTAWALQGPLGAIATDRFFEWVLNPPGSQVGDHFVNGFGRAVALCPPDGVLHLCTVDRLAYALQTEHREAFMRDVRAAGRAEQPILFQRSAEAWATHPRTYRAVEAAITAAGEVLFGRELDFAWCHMAVRAERLSKVLPRLEGIHDMSFFAETVLALRNELITRDVDWLAWEDPFILGRDPVELRRAREGSPAESEKRLGYAIPMLEALLREAQGM